MIGPISREEINEMLREQERELPLGQMQPVVDPADEAERRLRREWRQQRRERRERQQEPEGSWEPWERWVSARIQAAIAEERVASAQERKALIRDVESVVGAAVAQLLHSLRSDLDRQLDAIANKMKELETLWLNSSTSTAGEIAELQRELGRLLKNLNTTRADLALPLVSIAN
jgi:hypothetical protein